MIGCGQKVPVTVPSGFDYKTVKLPCGCTGPGGHQVLCEMCMPTGAKVYRRHAIQRDYDGYR